MGGDADFASQGKRTALMVFETANSSQIPAIIEPLMQGLSAKGARQAVMNFDDLQAGLAALGKPPVPCPRTVASGG